MHIRSRQILRLALALLPTLAGCSPGIDNSGNGGDGVYDGWLTRTVAATGDGGALCTTPMVSGDTATFVVSGNGANVLANVASAATVAGVAPVVVVAGAMVVVGWCTVVCNFVTLDR